MCPMQSGRHNIGLLAKSCHLPIVHHNFQTPPLDPSLDPDRKSRSEEITIKAIQEIHMKTSEKYSLQNIG